MRKTEYISKRIVIMCFSKRVMEKHISSAFFFLKNVFMFGILNQRHFAISKTFVNFVLLILNVHAQKCFLNSAKCYHTLLFISLNKSVKIRSPSSINMYPK